MHSIAYSILTRFADETSTPVGVDTGMTKMVCVLLAFGLAVVAVRTARVVGRPP